MFTQLSGKAIPSNEEAKYKSKKAQDTFGDSELTNSCGAKFSFKNLRGNKARKVD